LRADDATPGAGAGKGEEALDRTGREDVVVVERQDVIAVGGARQETARPGGPPLLVEPDLDLSMGLWLQPFQVAPRQVIAAVPEQREGPVTRALAEHRLDALGQPFPFEHGRLNGNTHGHAPEGAKLCSAGGLDPGGGRLSTVAADCARRSP